MSSGFSGRYQSRLFNFVHRQSRRFTEHLGSAFRHLQVATSWVAPVVLYPIYLLFRATRTAGKQLYQAVQQSWPQLQDASLAKEEFSRQLPPDDSDSQPQTPPTADMPIQRVLLLVDALPSEEEPADSLSRKRPVVRGIATQLSSRTLVLVTPQNEILDILTTQQQQKLQERIIGQLADYWRLLRLADSSGQQFTARLQRPTEQDSPNPVVRLFNRALALLDRTVADLESNHLAPVSKVAIAADGSETHTFKIQALIWAAIDYFFGRRGKKHLEQTTPTGNSLELPTGSTHPLKPLPHRRSTSNPDSQQLSSPGVVSLDVDPWLTSSDLFGDPESVSEPLTSLPNPNARFRLLLPQPKQASALVERKKHNRSVTQNDQAIAGKISNATRSQSTHINPAPDWIDTHATAMGYLKHPLEQLMEWLDLAMLWLEELLVSIFEWVQQLWRGK